MTKSVVVEAGKAMVVVLPGCVETDNTVVVCPRAVLVMVNVNDEAGKVLMIVVAGTNEMEVLTETTVVTRVVVASSGAAELVGSTSSPGFSTSSSRMAENAGLSDSTCPFTSE